MKSTSVAHPADRSPPDRQADPLLPVGPRCVPPPRTERHIAEQANTIIRWTEYDRRGHFAAMEQPDLLVGDICEFFRQLRDAPAD